MKKILLHLNIPDMSLAGRRFILGDVHGFMDKLENVLSKASFDIKNDTLYFLGDICDRGRYTYECIKLLRTIANFHSVVGNHDLWLRHYLLTGDIIPHWVNRCGGDFTVESIESNKLEKDEREDIGYWIASWKCVLLLDDSIILHGGIPQGVSDEDLLVYSKNSTPVPLSYDDCRNKVVWDREYLESAQSNNVKIPPFKTSKTIYVGHTPIGDIPFYNGEYHIRALDTGSGYEGGRLTLMNMDSGEYFQA